MESISSPAVSPANKAALTEAVKKRLWEKFDELPQRDLIDMSDAKQWIDYMSNVMPEDAIWHMIRAGGVGGSEIGGLVRNYLGHLADHAFNAHDWALGKLLRSTPEPEYGVLQRGHEMEPIHAKRFYKELRTRRDEVAFEALKRAKGQLPWMRYSPDEMVHFDSPTTIMQADGPVTLLGRVLVDYKAPTTVDAECRIAFQYSAQLHQGATLCREQGIDLSGAMLSQFNWATWTLKNDFVEIDPQFCDLIKEAGSHYWDYVMRGEIPPYVMRRRLELDNNVREDWTDAAIRLGQLNAMCTNLSNAAEELRGRIVKGLGLTEKRLDGQTISFPSAIKISGSAAIDEDAVRRSLGEDAMASLLVKEKNTKYDADAMLGKLKSLGVDVKPFRKLSRLDPSLTFNALVDAGLDPEKFMKESLRITVDRDMKESAADWFGDSFEPLKLPAEADEADLAPLPGSEAEFRGSTTNQNQNFLPRPTS